VSDPRIAKYVETKLEPIARKETREMPLRLATVRQQHNAYGGFHSSARVRAEDEVHLESVRLLGTTRTRILIQTHRSYGVAIEGADIEEVSQAIAAMIATELAERGADSYRGAYAAAFTEGYKKNLEEVQVDALAELRAAQMEQEMPKREQAPGSVIIFNAPNFGTVAAQIGT
jgi:hypothetical protein